MFLIHSQKRDIKSIKEESMKYSLIFLSCLLSLVFLQIDFVSASCGCGKKKHFDSTEQISFGGGSGGCGCGGGGGNGSNDIPPDQE
jgi:hypothetical protein